MQQTALDRWLRRKYIYITRIYCNTLPADLPPGLHVEEAPEESGGRYLYKMSTTSEEILKGVIDALSNQNITYTSRIEDKPVWYNRFLNNPNKSFTYRCAWTTLAVMGVIFAVSGLPQKIWEKLTEDEAVEEVVENQSDDVKIFHNDGELREIDRVKQ